MAHSKESMAQMPGAMGKFNSGHWEKKESDVAVGGSRYSSGEMNQAEDYKKNVDALSGYVKKHKAQH